jgi:outer membrane lipase/esterase
MSFRSIVLRAAGVLAVAATLASCGGESLVPFNPSRILVFGDQASVVTLEPVPAEGKKYTINALNADGTFNCSANLIWVQVLALNYGKGFPECPYANESGAPASRILAQAGATAAGVLDIDLAQQITRQLDKPAAEGGGIGSADLVTVFVGVNDVVELYKLFEAGISADEVSARAETAGVAIATQIARIADAGGKVIVATVPDVGLTPFGRSKDVAGRALLSALTLRVNNQFLLTLQNSGNNNGRKIGLIEINPYLINVVAYPLSYGYALDGVRDSACLDLPLPPDCTTQTLKAGATASTWLWANETQLTPKGHLQLGSLATTRARNQPFQ